MRRLLVGLVVAGSLLGGTGPALAYRDGGNCNREGSCPDQRHCADNEGDCTDNHKSFSPTFDKSPVDHSGNITICVMPGSCTGKSDQPPPGGGQKPSSDQGDLVCTVKNLPYHCDSKPQ